MSIFELLGYWVCIGGGMAAGGVTAWIVGRRRERAEAMKRTFRATVLHTMDDLNRAFASRPSKPLVDFDKVEITVGGHRLEGLASGHVVHIPRVEQSEHDSPNTWPAIREDNNRWERIAQLANARKDGKR